MVHNLLLVDALGLLLVDALGSVCIDALGIVLCQWTWLCTCDVLASGFVLVKEAVFWNCFPVRFWISGPCGFSSYLFYGVSTHKHSQWSDGLHLKLWIQPNEKVHFLNIKTHDYEYIIIWICAVYNFIVEYRTGKYNTSNDQLNSELPEFKCVFNTINNFMGIWICVYEFLVPVLNSWIRFHNSVNDYEWNTDNGEEFNIVNT